MLPKIGYVCQTQWLVDILNAFSPVMLRVKLCAKHGCLKMEKKIQPDLTFSLSYVLLTTGLTSSTLGILSVWTISERGLFASDMQLIVLVQYHLQPSNAYLGSND